jgi:Lipocalin-like domain
MTRLMSVFAVLGLLLASSAASAQDLANQLVGVWLRTADTPSTRKYDDGSTAHRQLMGSLIFTKGGYFAVMQHPVDHKTASSPEERSAAVRNTFFGSGTYRVEGDQVILKYEVCGIASWIGTERKPNLKMDGKNLIWTTPQIKDPEGKTYVETYINVRAE